MSTPVSPDFVDEAAPGAGPPPPPAAAPGRSLRSRAVHGAAWTIVGYGASQVIRLAGNLVLTRLLFPEAFGVAALVSIFMQGLEMFSDVGIAPSIVRSPRGEDPDFLDTAWTIQAGRGLMLWAGSALIAVPAAAFYGVPQLALLIPVAGLGAAINGLNSTSLPLCSRRLLLGRMMVVDLSAQVVSLVAMAVLARHDPSPWALVIGGLTGSSLKLVLSHLALADRPNRLRWDRTAARELFRFGRWIFLSTLITFFAGQVDRLTLGKLSTLGQVGVYTMAQTLSQVPRAILQRLQDAVIYPTFARLIREPGGDLKAIRIRRILLLAAAPLCAALMVTARPIVALLLDPRYEAAGDYLGLLMIGTWFQLLQTSYGAALMAKGSPKYIGAGVALRLAIFAGLAWPAYERSGVAGIAALSVLAELGVVAACTYGAARIGMATVAADLAANGAFACAIVAFEAARGWISGSGDRGVAAAGLAGAAIAAILAAALIRWAAPRARKAGPHYD